MSTGLPKLSEPCLLADIGGTNARFALLLDGEVTDSRTLNGAAYGTIGDAARDYLSRTRSAAPSAAAIAIAAPVTGDEVRMTNHSWRFSIAEFRRELGVQRLIVLNDFTALAMSLPYLPREELRQIGGRSGDSEGSIALLGPGTGLGVSGLIPHRDAIHTVWTPLQGEGGHVTVAANTQREAAVIAVLRERFAHVSAERVVSGPGLINLYSALCAVDAVEARPLEPRDITDAALAGSDSQCVEALQMFCSLLGTVAGNLALTLGATGGVYVGGGIVPRLGDYFVASDFRPRFENKGRYRQYLAPIPVHVIHSSGAAFYGLARSFVDFGPRIEAH